MPIVSESTLKQLSQRILKALGASEEESAIVAESLASANLLGHDSHGVIRVPQYVKAIRAGEIRPGAAFEVLKETDTTVMVDGHWNFGQVVARKAMDLAITKAKAKGLAQLTVRNCSHIGRVGEYPQRAAGAGLACFMVANACGSGNVAPFGGYGPRLATNPVAFAAPWKEERVILLDMTTSIAPEGKVRVKMNRGEPLPEGWIVDAHGRSSTNPKDFYGPPPGALLPLGGSMGHKGFGLSCMVEILGGILSGAGAARPGKIVAGNGIYAVVIDIEALVPRDEFQQHLEQMIAYLKSSPTLPGFAEILIPGEPEFRTGLKRQQQGIPVEEETWRQLLGIAKDLGVGEMN